MHFPLVRMRRLRKSKKLRTLLQETSITPSNLIYPLFVIEGKKIKQEISSMPGIYRLSPDLLSQEIDTISDLGIPAVILFGIPGQKDEVGSENFNPEGVIPEAIRQIKRTNPEIVVITDVCMCEYTSHGHCGIVEQGQILNDPTLEIYGKTAIVHAQAGADIVAPSGMMDGQVKAIREALDRAGFYDVLILSYSAKFASAFYGPFRDAADSSPAFSDRKTYQLNPANAREAIREIELDIAEGADIIMIKPALAYLDIIKEAAQRFNVPIFAYNVSGEYSMVKASAHQGWIDEPSAIIEILISIRRAGAQAIITYHAKEVAKLLKNWGL